MKLKLVVVDLELTKRQKRLVGGLVAGVVLGGAAVALAAVPKTFVGGETLTAADLNANFADLDGRVTAVQAALADKSAFTAHKTQAQSVPSATHTQVLFDAVDFDLGGEYDAGTSTFTSASGGLYAVNCKTEYFVVTPNTNPGLMGVMIQVNGQDARATGFASDGWYATRGGGMELVQLAAGDELTCYAYQYTNATLDLSIGQNAPYRVHFSAVRL